MSFSDPQTLTALGGIVTAVAGLLTAIHAHSKATDANVHVQTSTARSETLGELVLLLLSAAGVALPSRKPPVSPSAAVPVSPPTWRDALVNWLREEHKLITGKYPEVDGVQTDWSKVIEQISRIEAS